MAGSEPDSPKWREAKETIEKIDEMVGNLKRVIDSRLLQPVAVNARFLDGYAYHLNELVDQLFDEADEL